MDLIKFLTKIQNPNGRIEKIAKKVEDTVYYAEVTFTRFCFKKHI